MQHERLSRGSSEKRYLTSYSAIPIRSTNPWSSAWSARSRHARGGWFAGIFLAACSALLANVS